jgi:hypothetical protein
MPTLTINIAGRGTLLSNGDASQVGHMWYSLTDNNRTKGVSIAFFLEQPCHVAHALT